jgi:hypothetical protein
VNNRGYVEDYVLGVIAFLTVAFIVWMIVMGAVGSKVNRACLTHGWPKSETLWDGTGYCHKRIDQTDSVILLKTLEAR